MPYMVAELADAWLKIDLLCATHKTVIVKIKKLCATP